MCASVLAHSVNAAVRQLLPAIGNETLHQPELRRDVLDFVPLGAFTDGGVWNRFAVGFVAALLIVHFLMHGVGMAATSREFLRLERANPRDQAYSKKGSVSLDIVHAFPFHV